ncbi:MAG: hypothetical protein M3Y35_15600 [Actinomycetota bacterium]|nr:hypothetical protein [Actinomycetota bacterium]
MNPVASRVLAVIESTGLSHRAFSAAVGIDPTKLSNGGSAGADPLVYPLNTIQRELSGHML